MIAAKAKKEAKTQKSAEAKVPETKDEKPITFLCKFCGQTKPVTQMAILTIFSPPLTACRECEKAMR
ncbi:MAG: hypothetical protein Q7R57_07150 [Dehalococcoidales bacterium]|nr:hypothetical protein [Dehalococcoidales bacterium]